VIEFETERNLLAFKTRTPCIYSSSSSCGEYKKHLVTEV